MVDGQRITAGRALDWRIVGMPIPLGLFVSRCVPLVAGGLYPSALILMTASWGALGYALACRRARHWLDVNGHDGPPRRAFPWLLPWFFAIACLGLVALPSGLALSITRSHFSIEERRLAHRWNLGTCYVHLGRSKRDGHGTPSGLLAGVRASGQGDPEVEAFRAGANIPTR